MFKVSDKKEEYHFTDANGNKIDQSISLAKKKRNRGSLRYRKVKGKR